MTTTAADTSVVVAALLGWHEQHAPALAALKRAASRSHVLVLPEHVLVESYAVLTRLPAPHRLAPATAEEMLRRSFQDRAPIVTLTGSDVWALLDAASRLQVAGGSIYDARILAAARKARADRLLTLDVRDFERLDAGPIRIVTPSGMD